MGVLHSWILTMLIWISTPLLLMWTGHMPILLLVIAYTSPMVRKTKTIISILCCLCILLKMNRVLPCNAMFFKTFLTSTIFYGVDFFIFCVLLLITSYYTQQDLGLQFQNKCLSDIEVEYFDKLFCKFVYFTFSNRPQIISHLI